MIILSILFFLCPLCVGAEIVETPYMYVGSVDKNYIVTENEKIQLKQEYVWQEVNPAMTDQYYMEGMQPINYPNQTQEFIYTKWSNWQTEKIDGLEEEQKITYTYQELQKIDQIVLDDIQNLLILSVKVIDRTTEQVIATWFNTYNSFYENILLNLEKYYSLQQLQLEITTFLIQEKINGQYVIADSSKKYVKEVVHVEEKGISNQSYLLINCMKRLQWDKNIIQSQELTDPIYVHVLDIQVEYRYRLKLYRYQKNPQIIVQEGSYKEGYQLINKQTKYELYRKETIELYDSITLTDYIDLSNIIKESTIPLKDIQIVIEHVCQDSMMKLSYQDFQYKKPIQMICQTIPSSKTVEGRVFSWKKFFLHLFVNLVIKKNF